MNANEVSYLSIISLVFFLIPIILINYKLDIRINKKIFYAIGRMVIQLSLVGVFLQYIFNINNSYLKKNKAKFLNKSLVDDNISITKNSTLNIVKNRISKNNIGINSKIHNAMELFSDYKTLLIFEDDLVISPYYLQLLKKCSIQYPNIVTSFHSIVKSDLNIPNDLNILRPAKLPRLWGFYLTRSAWDKFNHIWYGFYREDVITPFYDTVFTRAIRSYTDGKYEPIVPRAYNIGIDGILSTNELAWKKRKLDIQNKNIIYKEDKDIFEFILKEK